MGQVISRMNTVKHCGLSLALSSLGSTIQQLVSV